MKKKVVVFGCGTCPFAVINAFGALVCCKLTGETFCTDKYVSGYASKCPLEDDK